MTTEIETLKKEIAELRKAFTTVTGVKAPAPITISLKYLCPQDPKYKILMESEGVVMPEDAPQHSFGWMTEIKNVEKKHRTFGQDGRQIEFTSTHQAATWKCQTCGSEKNVDPYP